MTDIKIDLDKVNPITMRIEAMKGFEFLPVLVLCWHPNGTATVLFEHGEIAHREVNCLRAPNE